MAESIEHKGRLLEVIDLTSEVEEADGKNLFIELSFQIRERP